jgi:alkylation response protein AidB-like acyl-CoA dehydrogenase
MPNADAAAGLAVPALTPEVAALKARARRFVEEEVWPLEARVAAEGRIDEDAWQALRARARAAGFSNLNMPRELDGADLPMLALVAVEEEAGRATNGLGFVVADRGPRELAEMATPEQLERYVWPVVRGDTREAWAITEPGAGSDTNAFTTTARRDGGDWLLNGEKWFVTGGERSAYYITLARADGEPTLFLVDRDRPGLEVVREPHFMHDPYVSRHQELRLTDVRVPESCRVDGGGDAGAKVWFTVERLMIAARCCGAAERLIDLATGYAAERVAFGKPIVEHQAVQFMLADSLTELLAARLMTYHAAGQFDAGADAKIVHGKTSMAKLYASEMAGRVADRAVQVFGGRGYMTENPVERYYRELRVDRIWEGTSEIQRGIIGRALLKRGAAAYAGA